MFFKLKKTIHDLFSSNLVKLDLDLNPDPHSEKLLDPDPHKVNADCGSTALVWSKEHRYSDHFPTLLKKGFSSLYFLMMTKEIKKFVRNKIKSAQVFPRFPI